MDSILLVVLYKTKILESSTISSFCKNCINVHNKVKLVIWDNSPNNVNCETSCLDDSKIVYDYYHTPENLSLSIIYNNVMRMYNECLHLFIFDQDSVITLQYFELMYQAACKNKDIGLFVPYIILNNQIVSPGDFCVYKGKYWKNLSLDRILSKNRLCITSGMMLNVPLIKSSKICFDEKLSFYGIDTKFSLDYARKIDYFFVINYSLNHNLSLYEEEDFSTKIWRYKSHMNSLRYITRNRSLYSYAITLIVTTIHYLKLLLLKK